MARRDPVVCEGLTCRYYRRYYDVVQHNGAYVPIFGTLDERCSHPNNEKDTSVDRHGKRLIQIYKCPKI
jgi:hypothetical protein